MLMYLPIIGCTPCIEGTNTNNQLGQSSRNNHYHIGSDATSALQLGAAWPMFGRNQYHSSASPFIGSHTNTLKWSVSTGGGISSSPAIDANGIVYVGSSVNKLYAIHGSNGSEKWSFTTGGDIFSSPAIDAEGVVYVGSWDNKLYAIYSSNGSEK